MSVGAQGSRLGPIRSTTPRPSIRQVLTPARPSRSGAMICAGSTSLALTSRSPDASKGALVARLQKVSRSRRNLSPNPASLSTSRFGGIFEPVIPCARANRRFASRLPGAAAQAPSTRTTGTTKPCDTNVATNPAGCPPSWGEASTLCGVRPDGGVGGTPVVNCLYAGAGDCSAQCRATAAASCFDGGCSACAQ